VQGAPSKIALVPPALLRHSQLKTIDSCYASVALKFDAAIVAKVLTAMFDRAAVTKLDLEPMVDLSTTTGEALHSLARALVTGLQDGKTLQRSPKAMALLSEAILGTIFENVPHRLLGKLERDPPDLTPRQIQMAIEYMRGHIHLPLTIIDIAAAVGVSQRSLQASFRRFRDTTPMAYLRRLRLEAARAELANPENRLPIYEVALKWGFTHMGRFAAQYRAAFGETPSETFRRALVGY
jgi:AraC-like DNA-binding protein